MQIEGSVQGVGFRPYLFQLAAEQGLRGRVANSAAGVDLEVEGPRGKVEVFLADIPRRLPPLASITRIEQRFAEPVGHPAFRIAGSDGEGPRTALIATDVTVCDACLVELFDPDDRRHRHPFVNCTDCGPRFTIVRDVPYDRSATTMACFEMCGPCRAEYEDPASRRFHAQASACPDCGPRVWLTDGDGSEEASDDPIESAVSRLEEGAILAVKGIGGFHLVCDATDDRAVERLRARKGRDEKPFALMVPDLEVAQRLGEIDPGAERWLVSPARPITLVPGRPDAGVSQGVAPGCRDLGLMLPYAPLHHLLFRDRSGGRRFRALVVTSGNRKDEPIATGNRQALSRLEGVADAFLLHDRDIEIRADDSVVRTLPGVRPAPDAVTLPPGILIRRSRGFVPEPIFLERDVGEVLAVGGHLKNTVALSRGRTVFLGPHVGDLDHPEALDALRGSVEHMRRILGVDPEVVAHDLHPDYPSTRYAQELDGRRLIPVQHHHAHIAACMAEHGLDGPVIGVALDGTGYGTDGHVWGGELLMVEPSRFQRVGHLREVPLAGGEQAIRQPWRMALVHLEAAYGEEFWDLPIPFVKQLDRERAELLLHAARRGLNAPPTSSCGRLFDAVAALAGIRQTVSFEGQAAMELESAIDESADEVTTDTDDPTSSGGDRPILLDPAPWIRAVVDDLLSQASPSVISRHFHQALVRSLAGAVGRIAAESGIQEVALGGGCFQNRVLLADLETALRAMDLQVFSPQRVPCNDGGLALGQIMVAAAVAAEVG